MKRFLNSFIILSLLLNILIRPAAASVVEPINLAKPLLLQGLMLDQQDASRVNFVLSGISQQDQPDDQEDRQRLMRYFLTALTIPSSKFWVNLSPFEQHRIISNELEGTLVGRDLLAQDYTLKQLAASLMDPTTTTGKALWANMPLAQRESISKVWIVADKAEVVSDGRQVMIVQSRLKVMTDEDYLALAKEQPTVKSSEMNKRIKDIIVPVLENEVNQGATFNKLRQMYQALILAAWYKKHVHSCADMVQFINGIKKQGIAHQEKGVEKAIYDNYVRSYKKGIVNRIIEEQDPVTKLTVNRKYFIGGFAIDPLKVYQESQGRPTLDGDVMPVKFQSLRPINNDKAMSAKPLALSQGDYQALLQEIEEIVKLNNTGDLSKLAPFVWGHHILTPFKDSAFGGFQQLEVLRRWLKTSKIVSTYVKTPALSDSVLVEDLDVNAIADFFSQQGWITYNENRLLKDTYALRPDFIKALNPEWMTSPRLTHKEIAEKIVKANDRRLIERMPASIANEPEQAYYFKIKESGTIADNEMIKYGHDLETIYSILQRALLRMVPHLDQDVQELGSQLKLVNMTQGLMVDSQLRLLVASEVNPVRLIRYTGSDLVKDLMQTPSLALRIFSEALRLDAQIDPELFEQIKLAVTNRNFAIDRESIDLFKEMLRTPKPIASLMAQLHRVGLLAHFFPIYHDADNFYGGPNHLMPLSWHSLYLLKATEDIASNDDPSFAFLQRKQQALLKGDSDQLLAYRLAIFLHDMQKDEDYYAFGRPHTIGGANSMVPQALKSLGVSKAVQSRVQWLVWYHQSLNAMADATPVGIEFFYDDLLELVQFANGALDQVMYDQLVLFTVADGTSVNPLTSPFTAKKITTLNNIDSTMQEFTNAPDVRARGLIKTKWMKLAQQQHTALFDQRREQFLKTSQEKLVSTFAELPFSNKNEVRDSVLESMKDSGYRTRIFDEYTTLFPFTYIRQTDPYNINKQLLMIATLRQFKVKSSKPVILPLTSKVKMGDFLFFEFFVGITADRPGILKDIAGVLAAFGLNVLEARINTTTDGVVIDTIQGYFIKQVNYAAIAQQLNDKLKPEVPFNDSLEILLPQITQAIISGQISLKDFYQLRELVTTFERSDLSNTSKTRVKYSEAELADGIKATQVNIQTADRNGLIFIVASIIQQLGFNIENAEPKTPQRLSDDYFRITARGNDGMPRPLNSAEKDKLDGKLKQLLDRPSLTLNDFYPVDLAMQSVGGIDLNLDDEPAVCNDTSRLSTPITGMRAIIFN